MNKYIFLLIIVLLHFGNSMAQCRFEDKTENNPIAQYKADFVLEDNFDVKLKVKLYSLIKASFGTSIGFRVRFLNPELSGLKTSKAQTHFLFQDGSKYILKNNPTIGYNPTIFIRGTFYDANRKEVKLIFALLSKPLKEIIFQVDDDIEYNFYINKSQRSEIRDKFKCIYQKSIEEAKTK